MKLIYFRATDLGVDDGVQISPQLGGIEITQSVKMHPNIGGLPAWTAVVDNETLSLIEGHADFAGVGVDGVIDKYPQVAKYLKYVTYELDDETFTITEDKKIPSKATKVLSGFARHTFAGYDPYTGLLR